MDSPQLELVNSWNPRMYERWVQVVVPQPTHRSPQILIVVRMVGSIGGLFPLSEALARDLGEGNLAPHKA